VGRGKTKNRGVRKDCVSVTSKKSLTGFKKRKKGTREWISAERRGKRNGKIGKSYRGAIPPDLRWTVCREGQKAMVGNEAGERVLLSWEREAYSEQILLKEEKIRRREKLLGKM